MIVSRARKLLVGGLVLLIAAAVVAANLWFKRADALSVSAEAISKRDLQAIVSASGKIQPKRSVNISANSMGRVTRLAVNEGDRVKRGQFLLQIDPKSAQSSVERGEASLQAARSALQQARVGVETARANLDLAQENLKRQRDLWSQGLTTREALDRAENDVTVRETERKARQADVSVREQQIRQEMAGLASSRYTLSLVTLDSPIDGIVTRRNIEEGENVLVGTMNNAGTVLLTIADMSVIEAEVEVDETDVPTVALGQPAKVTIDALPDRTFAGRVTEIGNSPIQPTAAQSGTARQATNFKVVVTLDSAVPEVRPGFTCTADITTATRSKAVSVPIQALTVREMVYDAAGTIVREPRQEKRRRRGVEPSVAASELKPGQSRKETEGVFVVRGGRADFLPVKVGIAGDKYFEVLSGLNEGDLVVTGPYSSVRQITDGDPVKLEEPNRNRR